MKQDLSRIAVVLDRSGSMESIRAAAIAGFNEFLAGQKQLAGRATLILNQFDDVFETVFDLPLEQAHSLTKETFVPRGATALLDAIGRTVDEVGKGLAAMPEAERPAKVIVVIVTDGEENSSRTYSLAQVNAMITHQREKYAWEFLFLAANQDAIATASQVGIAPGSALQFSANAAATAQSFAAASRVAQARRGAAGPVDFTESERKSAS